MLRLVLALSSLAVAIAALSQAPSEQMSSLRLEATPTWLKTATYATTDVLCGSPTKFIGEAVGVCYDDGSGSSSKLEYISDTGYAYRTFSGVTDCSGAGTLQSTTTFSSGICSVNYNSFSPELIVVTWEYAQPVFGGGGIQNEYSTTAACTAKTSGAIASSTSFPWTTNCELDTSTSTYTKTTISVDKMAETVGYTTASCATSTTSEVTYTSCVAPYALTSFGVTPAGGGDDDDVCFSGSETLLLETGSVIAMESVQVGDRVQVASASDGSLSFAEVIFLPHERNDKLTTFIEVQTTTASLKATPSHLIMAGSCGANDMSLTRVEDISVGDCMDSVSGEDVVIASEKSLGSGVYSVITSHADGIIVVNGFKASSFAVSHMVVNNYYQIHRAIYAHFPAVIKALAGFGQLLGSTGAFVISA